MQLSDVATDHIDLAARTQPGFGGSINLGSNGQLRVFLNDRIASTRPNDVATMMTGDRAHALVPTAKVVAIPATGTRGGNSQPIDFTVTHHARRTRRATRSRVLQALARHAGHGRT